MDTSYIEIKVLCLFFPHKAVNDSAVSFLSYRIILLL